MSDDDTWPDRVAIPRLDTISEQLRFLEDCLMPADADAGQHLRAAREHVELALDALRARR